VGKVWAQHRTNYQWLCKKHNLKSKK
jgi:hypothetical protein